MTLPYNAPPRQVRTYLHQQRLRACLTSDPEESRRAHRRLFELYARPEYAREARAHLYTDVQRTATGAEWAAALEAGL